MKICDSVTECIGNTPLIRLHHIEEKFGTCAKILAKAESFNPAGSAKDRVALSMILDMEEKGLLKPGSTVIEPTSGNTGIGLCAVCATRGYKTVIVMPETMSEERKMLMRAFGAELVLTPGALGMKGSIDKAEELKKTIPGSVIAGQFVNPANPAAHIRTTGPEIMRDTDGEVDIFVAGIGTGGTVSGVGAYLKSQKRSVKVIGVEPERSPLLTKGSAGPHGIQGIGANFVPEILDRDILDEVIAVSDDDAYRFGRECARTEGLLVGISSGAALAAAVEAAKREENRGKTVVVFLPDTGDRYLSTPMFKE
ncbi:MAG: cysteine synthase A [Clostridia bacterium]|nr:cysteine synthase A [Clostridia bacterium]